MKKQIKKYGNSKVIILTAEELRFFDADVGDYLDISDSVKVFRNKSMEVKK